MMDEELIEKKIDMILRNLDYLEEIKEIDDEEFLKDCTKTTSFEGIERSARKHG